MNGVGPADCLPKAGWKAMLLWRFHFNSITKLLYKSHTSLPPLAFQFYLYPFTLNLFMAIINTFRIIDFYILLLSWFLVSSVCVWARPATFVQDFQVTWSESHIKQIDQGRAIQLILDQNSGKPHNLNSCLYILFPMPDEQKLTHKLCVIHRLRFCFQA